MRVLEGDPNKRKLQVFVPGPETLKPERCERGALRPRTDMKETDRTSQGKVTAVKETSHLGTGPCHRTLSPISLARSGKPWVTLRGVSGRRRAPPESRSVLPATRRVTHGATTQGPGGRQGNEGRRRTTWFRLRHSPTPRPLNRGA